MPFSGLLDVLVYVHNIRNIDLIDEGVYALRLRVYQLGAGDKTKPGIPYGIFDSRDKILSPCPSPRPSTKHRRDESLSKRSSTSDRHTAASSSQPPAGSQPTSSLTTPSSTAKSHIPSIPKKKSFASMPKAMFSSEFQSFTSSAFMLKYSVDEVDVAEMSQFRLELDLSTCPNLLSQPVHIEFELLYAKQSDGRPCPIMDDAKFLSPMKSTRTPSPPSKEYIPKLCQPPSHVSMTGIANQTITIKNPIPVSINFFPVIFGERNFCACNVTIHTLFYDVRYRIK